MSARKGRVPTTTEIEAFGLGKLEPQRASEVEAYLAEHPELAPVLAATPDDEVVQHLRGAGALPTPPVRSPLLRLAVEAVFQVVGGCAGAVVGGVAGGLVGVAVGQLAEKGINVFGPRIVEKWMEWFRRQPPASREAALAELAEVPPEVARSEAMVALGQASPEYREVAIEYLSAIPRSVRRSLLSSRGQGRSLPPSISLEDPLSLLQLLPAGVPPYPAPTDLPGTQYRLEELLGCGGFGAVYRASSPSEQYLSRAIKFCLDRSLLPVLEQERANLERLMEAGNNRSWPARLVRLYGYDLGHRTPYLVYEYVPGGDLVHWLERRQAQKGRGLTPDEVLILIRQVVEALAVAHERGLVHRDLKPANILMEGGKVKLADFGIGGLAARQAVQGSRIGTVSPSQLSPAEQVSLFRGAGTPLYMSPEQRRGEAPDPRHDLYSLGVMWYQLLAGDVTREMSHGWARELEVKFATPREHINLIENCVGWIEDRPNSANELLRLLRVSGNRQVKAPPADPPDWENVREKKEVPWEPGPGNAAAGKTSPQEGERSPQHRFAEVEVVIPREQYHQERERSHNVASSSGCGSCWSATRG